nr:hypothetical protein [Porphyridium purpureum]
MTNHTKAEPIKKAEGRFDIIQKRIAWKINKYILVHNSYFVKKEARLFNTFQQTKKIYKIISIKINIDKKWDNRLFSSGLSKVKNTTYFYKTAIKTDSLYKAFKSIKEQNVPGIDGHTKATFSKQLENSIVKLNKDLRSHKYQPSPIKTIYISRPNGGKRSLGVSSLRDKIVQATLKHEIEKIYEPIFKDCSYGFRPKLSSHSALKQIKKTWQLTKWLILLDISKCFDSANKQVFYTSNPFIKIFMFISKEGFKPIYQIQHEVLIYVLKKQTQDREFIDLMWKLLKVGYVDIHNLTNREDYRVENIINANIISPLMCNIYFHELDKFIEDRLTPKFSVKQQTHLQKTSISTKELVRFKKTTLSNRKSKDLGIEDNKYNKKIYYIRYADTVLLGIVDTKNNSRKLVSIINIFLKNNLKLKLNLTNCKVNLVWKTLTSFLGLDIIGYQNNTTADLYKKSNTSTNLSLLIPLKTILEKLVAKKYLRKIPKVNKYKGVGVGRLVWAADKKIVQHFSLIIKSYVRYYTCANKRSRLWYIINALRESCCLTLAWKHKVSSKKKLLKSTARN